MKKAEKIFVGIFWLLVVFVVSGLFYQFAFADVVYYQQSDDSVSTSTPPSAEILIGSFNNSVERDFSSASLKIRMKNATGFCHNNGNFVSVKTDLGVYKFGWNSFADLQDGSDNFTDVFATTTHLDATGGSFVLPIGSYEVFYSSQCNNGDVYEIAQDVFHQFYGVILDAGSFDDPYSISDSTRITSVVSPLDNTTEPDVDVTFDFDFFYNDTLDPDLTQACARLDNVSLGTDLEPLCTPLIISGNGSFQVTATLIAGNSYYWRPSLETEDFDPIKRVSGGLYLFGVISPPSLYQTLFPLTEDQATSTIQFNLLQFLNPAELLFTKFPFNWAVEIVGIFASTTSASTTAELPEVALDFSEYPNTLLAQYLPTATTSHAAALRYEVFSTTTLANLMIQVPALNTARSALAAILWFGLAIMAFRSVEDLFSKSET